MLLLVGGFFVSGVAQAQEIQYYGTITGSGLGTEIDPALPYPAGTGLYKCSNYSSGTLNTCSGSASSYTAGNNIGIGGASINGTYYEYIFSQNVGSTFNSNYLVCYYKWTYNSGVWSTPAEGNDTRISTVAPSNGASVATSTNFTIGSTGFTSTSDFSTSSTKLRIKLTYDGASAVNAGIVAGLNSACFTTSAGTLGFLCNQLLGLDLLSTTQDFDITGAGYYSLSTTTMLNTSGRYTMKTSIVKPFVSILGFNVGETTLASYNSSFTVGTTTAYDDFIENVDGFVEDAFTDFDASSCNLVSGNFDFGVCVVGLIIPSGNVVEIYTELPDLLMTRFPFSYVSGIAYTWQSLENGTTASPSLAFNFADLGIGSSSPMGNILPNVTVFSSSTISTYLSGSILTAFKALVSLALILGLFANIFFSVKRIFEK